MKTQLNRLISEKERKIHKLVEKSLSHLKFGVEKDTFFNEECVPGQLGKGNTRVVNIADRIKIIHRDIVAHENLDVNYHERVSDNSIVGAFSLLGKSRSDLKDLNTELMHRPLNAFWGNLPNERCASFLPSKRTNMLYISVNKNLFHSCNPDKSENRLSEILTGSFRGVCDSRKISSVNYSIINSIISNPLKTKWDWIRIESKVLELVANCVDEFDNLNMKDTINLQTADNIRIEKAKEILISSVDDPPSIPQLAKLSGLNEFKLKKGFKQVYGNTVYGYLRDFRLKSAYNFLKRGDMNVTEVSFHIGYSNPSAFASAFKKKYGFNPKEIKRGSI